MSQAPDLGGAHLRIARPTDDLDAVTRFYRDGLGFEVIGGFEGHGEFDGVMLGRPGVAWHLEFTRKRGHEAGRAPTLWASTAISTGPPSSWIFSGSCSFTDWWPSVCTGVLRTTTEPSPKRS